MFLSRLTIVLTLVACGEKTVDETDEDVVEEEVVDADGDGVEESLDCDDSSADFGAIEEDTDCDGFLNDDDCGPEDADIYPGAEDAWYDGVDSNCDGADDYDQDGDGEASDQHDGTDCDDTDASINTSAEDTWYDGVDSNCDGADDYDQDGDGEASDQHDGTDCDDTDASINTSAEDTWYDGVDQNCDRANDYDQDGDGEDSDQHGGTDCEDTDATINTGATEVWYDGVDQNCDGADDYDQDGDGEASDQHGGTDCEDLDASIYANAVEFCDGFDTNCDGEGYQPGVVSYVDSAGSFVNYSVNQLSGSATGSVDLSTVSDEWHFCEGTYYETYELTDSVSIEGHGDVILSGEETDPVFVVQTAGVSLDLFNLTIQDGYNDSVLIERVTQDLVSGAGGLMCHQLSTQSGYTYVNIDSVSFLANTGYAGGALTVGDGCRVTVDNSVFEGNYADYGGGLFVNSHEELMVSNSTFDSNSSNERGGGVFLEGYPIAWSADITDHSTLTAFGENQSSSRTAAFFDTVDFLDNDSSFGGAIDARGAALHLDHATITNNDANYGGAIYQRASQISMFDGTISNNTANYGAAVRLYESSDISGNTSNVFSCSSITGSAIISGNVTSSSSSSAVHVKGSDAKVRLSQCTLGGNTGSSSDPDLKLEEEDSYTFSSTVQLHARLTEESYLQAEGCGSNASDSNGNGLIGWDDPSCSITLGNAYNSHNLENNIFDPDTSCYSNGSYSYNDAVADSGTMDWSGCLVGTVNNFQNSNFVATIMDDQQQSLVCAEGGPGLNISSVETEVEKGENYWIGTTFDEQSITSFVLHGNVLYGQDCDGNCCYDVYMSDSYGDGWTGAALEVTQGTTVVETISLTSGYDGWDSFCIDNGQSFEVSWNNSNQIYDDTEVFFIMQGDDSTGTTICGVTDPSSGAITSCGTNGVMTCQ